MLRHRPWARWYTRELGFCTNQPIPRPKRAGLSKARPFRVGMGARFGVTPERPSRRQRFTEGQYPPGINRVVRRPSAIPRKKFPKHLPASVSAIPSTSEPKPPAAFPVGYAAGGWFRRPQPSASPTPGGTYIGSNWPKPQTPSSTAASYLYFHVPTGVPQLEPDRFHPYPRAPASLSG